MTGLTLKFGGMVVLVEVITDPYLQDQDAYSFDLEKQSWVMTLLLTPPSTTTVRWLHEYSPQNSPEKYSHGRQQCRRFLSDIRYTQF